MFKILSKYLGLKTNPGFFPQKGLNVLHWGSHVAKFLLRSSKFFTPGFPYRFLSLGPAVPGKITGSVFFCAPLEGPEAFIIGKIRRNIYTEWPTLFAESFLMQSWLPYFTENAMQMHCWFLSASGWRCRFV